MSHRQALLFWLVCADDFAKRVLLLNRAKGGDRMSEILCPDVINSVGLVFDIGGVILLFFYGLPADVSKTGETSFLLADANEEEANKWQRYNKISYLALVFLGFGFFLQLVSNWL